VFTNCIATLYYADGVMRHRPVLFTYSTWFNPNPAKTAKAQKKFRETEALMQKYGITWDDIVYFEGKPVNGSKKLTYMKETPELVELFFEKRWVDSDVVLFSDDGKAFKEDGVPILRSYFDETGVYPPPIHQFVSPNDNNLHGAAKRQWRAAMDRREIDPKNDVEQSLYLLCALINVRSEHVQKLFKRNFQIGAWNNPDLGAIAGLVSNNLISRIVNSDFYSKSLEAYCKYAKIENPIDVLILQRMVENKKDGLNGPYWFQQNSFY
jgi:hypothetical protein